MVLVQNTPDNTSRFTSFPDIDTVHTPIVNLIMWQSL